MIKRLFIAAMILFVPTLSFGEQASSGIYGPIGIRISLEKDVVEVGQDVEGSIEVENTYASGIPAIFIIKLIKENEEVSAVTTFIQHVPWGKTNFTLKGFGVPSFNRTADTQGRWSIAIFQQNTDESQAQRATVQVIPRSSML